MDQNRKQDERDEGKRPHSAARLVNAVIAVVVVVVFFAHAVLGAVSQATGWHGALVFVVWAGVVLIAAHVVMSVVTTREMFTDTVRPPSERKRRHQWLKWASGGAVALLAIVHIVAAPMGGEESVLPAVIAVLLVVALAWHACVGVKSLTRDLNFSKNLRLSFRVAVIAVAVAVVAVMLFVMMR